MIISPTGPIQPRYTLIRFASRLAQVTDIPRWAVTTYKLVAWALIAGIIWEVATLLD